MSSNCTIIDDLKDSNDYIYKDIEINHCKMKIIYNETLIHTYNMNQTILDPMQHLTKKQLKNMNQYIMIGKCIIIEENDITYFLNSGYVIIIYNQIYAFPSPTNLSRGIPTIDSELSLTGPKDSFIESFSANLGLLRKRIKSEKLKCNEIYLGRYTKTRTGILYVDGIVKKDLVRHVIENLEKIDIDGILDSSYLKSSLEKKVNLFPTIIMTERPDKCCMALLEGKVVLVVDNSPYALILPGFFLDCFHTTDDYYQKSIHVSFIRIIRFLAFLIAIYTPAIYLSVTTRNYDLVSFNLLLVLKAGRSYVPFPAYIEALFMIICFEILKESDLRMSNKSGSAISILGGLILGDAAVAAGIVSPIMIIVIAISSIAGLIFTSIELSNALRNYKIIILILSTIFGIYGVILGLIILLINLFTTETFGYNYLALDKHEIKDSIIKIDTNTRYRNSKLSNNIIRGKYK